MISILWATNRNLSCPHVAKMGMEVGDDPEMVSHIVKTIKSNIQSP